MAKAGLSFANPFMEKMNVGEMPNPYDSFTPLTPPANIGLGNLGPSLADMAALGEALTKQSQFTMPEMRQPTVTPSPAIAYSPSRNELFVQGVTFPVDDAATALKTESLLNNPSTGIPAGGDWQPLDVNAYRQWLGTIRNPSLGNLFAKNFGRGVDELQMLGGRFLQWLGAENLGSRIVKAQEEDLARTAPFDRRFADINSGRDAVEWFVANLAQQGPNLLESIATALGSFAIGTAAGGPLVGAGAALAGLAGKSAFKQAVTAAARKYAAGETLNAAEYKLLREAAGLAGVAAGMTAHNVGIGIADTYGELREQGASADDNTARLKALAWSMPYGALELLPEFALAARVFGNVLARSALPAGTSLLRRGAEMARRAGVGLTVGGAAEGTVELGQEAILLKASDQDFSSPENINRLVESFAAGFGVGGPIGAAAHLRSNHPTNLLNPAQSPEPPTGRNLIVPPGNSPTPSAGPSTAVQPYYTPATSIEVMPSPPEQLTGPLTAPQLPAPVSPVEPMGGPQIMVTPEGVAYPDQMLRQHGNVPPSAPGTQGVLNIFGGQISAQELASRMQPTVFENQSPTLTQTVVTDPRQGALQFSEPVSTEQFNTQQTQIQQQVPIQQQLDVLAQQQALAPQEQEIDSASMPMRQVGPTQPVQLPLFSRRQAPRPSRAEGLRRGIGTRLVEPTIETPQTVVSSPTQLPLFTQEGEPSLPALRAAGVKTKLPPTPLAQPSTKQRSKRGLKKQAGVAEVNIVPQEVPYAIQEQSPTPIPARQVPETGNGVGAEIPTEQKPARKGEALKTKAKERQVAPEAPPAAVVLKKGQPTETKQAAPAAEALKKGQPTETKQAAPAAETLRKGRRTSTKQTTPKAEPLKKGQSATMTREEQLAEAGRQWEEYADPDTQPKWAELTNEQKEQWRKIVVDERKPTIAAAEEIAPPKKPEAVRTTAQAEQTAETVSPKEESEPTPAKILEDEIAAAEEATDIRTFKDAIQTVIHYAFFAGEDTNVKKLADRARAFLNNTQFSDTQQAAMDEAFLEAANYETQLEAVYKGGSRKGQMKPWFSYAVSRGLLPSIKARIINLPSEYKTQMEAKSVASEQAPTKSTESSIEKITETPEALLGELINDLITRVREYDSLKKKVAFRGKTYTNLVALAKELYAKTSEQGKNYIVRGHKLREYFKADGSPKLLKSDERYIITTQELTTEQQRALEREQKAEAKAIAAEYLIAERERARLEQEGFKVEDAWDDPDGMFYRDNGTEIKSTIPPGRVRLLVKSFLNKLRIKPNVYIYANVADLKRRNPDLYRRAATARKEGDFDTTNAVGYSFGPNVIIFTDFVRTEQQLKFVLAHETLGHFGFRSIVSKKDLDAVLNRIYNADPDIQAAVDAMVTNRGMSKLEAIEEYLADNAADLDTSIIARIWNVVKNFLNKLGFTFQDDEARYFINLARKYVRRGDVGHFVNARSIVGDLEALRQDQIAGRYARVSAGDMGSRLFAAGALNRRFRNTGGLYGAMEAFAKGVFGARHDVPGVVARLLEQVQTLDHKARRSYGLNQIYRLLEKQQHFARALLSKYQRMTAFTHSVDLGFLKKGVTEAEKERAGELLARAALLRSAQATDELIKSFGPLVTVDDMGNVIVDPAVRAAIERAGFVTAEEFRKGFDITYSDGSTVHFQYDVDENSPEWKVYLEIRNAVNEAAIDLMLSNYEAAQAETKRVLNDLNAKRRGTNVFTAEDLAAIRKVAAMYQAKRYAGSSVANAGVEIKRQAEKDSEEFLIAFGRALFNDDVFAAWMKDPNAKPAIVKDMEEFLKAEYDDIRAQLPSLRAKVKSEEQSFQIQKAIRDIFLFDLQSKNADYYAKRTILGSYVPFSRRGFEQVKLVAVDARGNPVALDPNIRSALPYFQFNSRREAMAVAEELDKIFGGDNEFVLLDENGSEVTVRLKAEVSRTRQSPDLSEAVNFNEFVYVLNRLNVNLSPEARERIITTLTAQNARARHNLQRSGTEGWDKDVVRSVSEYLETTAHVAAKKLFRHRLDDILLNDSYWLGDDQKLADLKAAVENAQTDGERARAQRAYDEYAYMYRYMKGAAGENTVVIDGKEVPTLGRGEDYREEAKQVLRWYSETTNIADSTEDLLSGEVGSRLKLLTVLMQLGGSVATAVVNLSSLVTHALPYLAYYNPTRGFGGGYGEAKAAAALWKAAKDVKNFKLADPAFLEQILRNGTYERYGLTEDEAQFLLAQTEEGTLQAAQFNALVGTARGKVFNNKAQAAVQAWMSMFSYTEQFNRRVTALAAYRLEKDRLRAQGVTDEQQLIDAATEAARVAVNTSQGEYAMYNRPEMARGNVLQYVFMYKQFVIITVQLLRSLPPKGQLLMLGFLLLTSGLRGLPFAEDIFDIVDTIAQKLGLKMASVEKEITEWLDAVAPGMTPYVMRGLLDRVTSATISTRMGMGDLVPLTGAFKAGADPAKEMANFAGPVFGGISGLIGMAGSLARYGAEAIGLRDDVTSFSSIMRNSPIAAVQAIADGLAYLDSGMITNNRGQVISREAPYHVILARMLGFYPAIATEQNDIVRLSKDVANYAKAIKAEFVSAYVQASLNGDNERMQKIIAAVDQWNRDAEGTGLEISTFVRSANRAALEASRPTALRYLKAAPKHVRPETEELLRIHGLADEIN
jgi:hypothetical protein